MLKKDTANMKPKIIMKDILVRSRKLIKRLAHSSSRKKRY